MSNTHCVVLLCFVFVLCFVYPMLPVFLSIVYSRLRLRFYPTFINKTKWYIVAISFPYKLHTKSLHIQYIRTLSENIHFILTSSITGRKKQALGKIFWPVSQRVQINFIFTDDVRIMCFYCNIKKSRRTAKLSEKSRNKHDYDGVFYHVRTYTVPFLAVALNESGTSKAW